MAFVFNPNKAKDKDKQNQAEGQGQALSQGDSSAISSPMGAPQTPGTQKQSSSGRFTNIQQFVKANDPGQLAGQVTGKIGQEKAKAAGQLQEAKSAVDKSAQSTGEAVAASKAKLQGAQQGLQGAYTAQGGPVSDEAFGQNLEGFKQGMGLQYQGAEDLGDQANLRAQAQNLQSIGQATQNASGRNALLNRFFGNPQYAAGQRTLDTLLLGSQRPKLQQAAAQANTFGGELDTARRAALGQIGQARAGVTGVQEEAKQGVLGQIGTAKGSIEERAAQAQGIRDLLRKQDSELQLQADANRPNITGDARSDAALQQAMQSGFIDQAGVDRFKSLLPRLQNAGFNTRDVLSNTLLQGNETGDQLSAIAASKQQAGRLNQLQKLVGQDQAFNSYAYDPSKSEQAVSDRENAIVNALRNSDFGFNVDDESQRASTLQTAAKLGLISAVSPSAWLPAATYGAAAGTNAVNNQLDKALSKDPTGLSSYVLPGVTLGQFGGGDSPLKYASLGQYAGSLGNLSNAALDQLPGLSGLSSGLSNLVSSQKAQRAAAAAATAGFGGVGAALGGIKKLFCFAPNTLVQMADGSYIEIQDVRLGDHMANGGAVYSISSHLIDESQVYEYNGIIVTANHAVQENGRWVRVKDSSAAKPAPGATSVVYSLSNDKHRIETMSGTFADYDEVDNSEGLTDQQCLMILNRRE